MYMYGTRINFPFLNGAPPPPRRPRPPPPQPHPHTTATAQKLPRCDQEHPTTPPSPF